MKKIIYVTIVFSVIFLSCKKKGDVNNDITPTPTPVASKPITRADLYPENGYISGTIVGKTSSGMSYEKTFTHQLDGEMATYHQTEMGEYIIHLNKLDKYGRVGGDDQKIDITFVLAHDKVTLSRLNETYISLYIDSSAVAITQFKFNSTSFQKMVLSNVLFNTTYGTFEADYVLSIPSSILNGKDNIITGKISTNLTNLRYRTGS